MKCWCWCGLKGGEGKELLTPLNSFVLFCSFSSVPFYFVLFYFVLFYFVLFSAVDRLSLSIDRSIYLHSIPFNSTQPNHIKTLWFYLSCVWDNSTALPSRLLTFLSSYSSLFLSHPTRCFYFHIIILILLSLTSFCPQCAIPFSTEQSSIKINNLYWNKFLQLPRNHPKSYLLPFSFPVSLRHFYIHFHFTFVLFSSHLC